MPKQQHLLAGLCGSLLVLTAATLCGCAQATIASGGPSDHGNPVATGKSSRPAAGSLPAFAAKQAEPQPQLTEQQASLQCWMKYEKGRRDLDLDTRAKLVDKCVDEKLHGHAAR